MINRSKLNIALYQIAEKALGKERSLKLLHERYIKVYRASPYIFIHIPKAAGTTISNLLYGKRNGHLTAVQIRESLGQKIFESKYSFSVVRNPYERLLSAYFYARSGGTSQGGIRNEKDYRKKEFRTFDSFIREWLVNAKLDEIDIIFRPQHHFLYEENNLLINDVFKLEDLSGMKYKLKSDYGLSFTANSANRNEYDRQLSKYYTRENSMVVNELYHMDFELFDFDFLEW